MTPILRSRRDFSYRLVSFFSVLGVAGNAFAHRGALRVASVAASNELSHTAEAIHQELIFKANRKRLYSALTDSKEFNKVVQLSEAGMSLGKVPTEISREEGGAFALFGGHIVGRHIELVANERIVQAWRAASWKPGVYSIVRFQLNDHAAGTQLVFDHTGFPEGQGQHLADGWKANYWTPLEKYLAA